MFIATSCTYAIQHYCYEFKIHFPLILLSFCCFTLVSFSFSLSFGYNFFACFVLSWFMFLELS